MSVSIFDLFSIGIGPSSSHTMGPMVAANDFIQRLNSQNSLSSVAHIKVELFGSLACTGKGHHTDKAIMLGLEGYAPESVDPDLIYRRPKEIENTSKIYLNQTQSISFSPEQDLIYHYQDQLDYHVNGMRLVATDAHAKALLTEQYYSVGGGFIVSDSEIHKGHLTQDAKELPYPFHTAHNLLEHCEKNNLKISEVIYANELIYHDAKTIDEKLMQIWDAMDGCIERGCHTTGIMPGSLKVKRRAPAIFDKLIKLDDKDQMLWLNLYALAVNEENGAGGRVVTAPTNGAAGIVPAVLKYHMTFNPKATLQDVKDYLLTAGGIALLYKMRASISGAEVGCQGEVGVACSMASGALAQIIGGDIWQVENAAEIGMEHHLGLTCDPIGGLVQIPCIERNAMAAVRAVNAAKLSLIEDGRHHVSLDQVIETMKKTGHDMLSIYKETSQGGLAVIYPEC